IERGGVEGMEILCYVLLKKSVGELKYVLWERARLVAQRVNHTPLRSIRSRSMLAFQITPPAMTDLWLERLAANGITELRTSDPSNTPKYWAEAIRTANRVGLKTILNIIYSISPKHSDDYFADRFREAAKLKPYRLCFKDLGDSSLPTQPGGWCRFFCAKPTESRWSSTPIGIPGSARCVAWKPSSSTLHRSIR